MAEQAINLPLIAWPLVDWHSICTASNPQSIAKSKPIYLPKLTTLPMLVMISMMRTLLMMLTYATLLKLLMPPPLDA